MTGVRQAVFAVIGVLAAAPAVAMSLQQAITLARQNDPALLAAGSNLSAALGRVVQARSALHPQLSLSLGANHNWREYATRDSPIPLAKDEYGSKNVQLNLSYALWRRANLFASRQSRSAAAQVGHQYVAAEQDMLLRLTQAWFELMQARDALVYAEGQSAAAKNQWEQLRYASQVGLASTPAAEEARYKYDQAEAEQVVAEGDLEAKLAALEQVLGPQPGFRPPALSEGFVPPALPATTLDAWLAEAEEQSPAVLAAKDALEAASHEVDKQRTGHEPTVDLVGNVGTNGQGAGSFPGQNGYDIKQRSIGIQVTVPLYAGGNIRGKVTEAVAMRERARHELEQARRNVRTAAKQAWFGWRAGQAHRAASQQALKFGSVSLQAAQAGRDNELRSALDVLQARQQHLAALRDLQRSRYEIITNHLKLLASAGRLTEADIVALDAWMTEDSNAALRLPELPLPAVPMPLQPVDTKK